jgi:hypothetical protein
VTGKTARAKTAPALRRSAPDASSWRKAFERLAPYRYPALLIAAVAVVLAGQALEDATDGALRMTRPLESYRRWGLVVLAVYELVIAALVYRTVTGSLRALAGVVRVSDAAYAAYESEVRRRTWTVDAALLSIAVVVVYVLFVYLGLELIPPEEPLSAPGPIAAVILGGYVLLGWAGLKLLYVAWRFGRLLGRLSREPLEISVFDNTPLLPFGNVALAVALAPAGVVIILFVVLGAPTTLFGWIVLMLASLASLLALLLPLRGVHRQMSTAKDAALAKVNVRLEQLFQEVTRTRDVVETEAKGLDERAGTLIPLRAAIEKSPTWPFRDTVAFGRAVLIALAPIIYTTLSEIIKIFVIAPLGTPQ